MSKNRLMALFVFLWMVLGTSISVAGCNLLIPAERTSPFELGTLPGNGLPVMAFDKKHIDLGKVKKGENVAFSYYFTNRGSVDLTIDFISGCDCTEIDWPVKTFKPGEKGKIDVVFLSGKKEKGETVEIDILLKNVHPETGNPMLEIISYSYTF